MTEINVQALAYPHVALPACIGRARLSLYSGITDTSGSAAAYGVAAISELLPSPANTLCGH